MEFLLQPFNRTTLIEEVNDSEIPTGPTRCPVVPVPALSLPAASASSADALICSPPHGAAKDGRERPQGSENSIEQVDPQAPGWTRRVRVGAAAPGRAPCPDRMTALEKSKRRPALTPERAIQVYTRSPHCGQGTRGKISSWGADDDDADMLEGEVR
ncbi:uncharacterized protein [Triticum aestivum]|uniref:uncharacterized protein isoform X3 n=1 Tax=Triticum aestivum TaxID=4565 RepID=UPI001D01ED09|nr:uncharacterized protein LOC123146853 isoform X3 [Triticum aestivum]